MSMKMRNVPRRAPAVMPEAFNASLWRLTCEELSLSSPSMIILLVISGADSNFVSSGQVENTQPIPLELKVCTEEENGEEKSGRGLGRCPGT